jgi:hypothetical protein
MDISLPNSINHLFADDLVGVISGQMGLKFSEQCLDLEKHVKNFLKHLEYYSLLTDQPINRDKSVAMLTARAIEIPKFDINFNDISQTNVKWVQEYKYLGYIVSSKLGWGKFLKCTMNKIRQRICLIRSFKVVGSTSPLLRKTLFLSFVLPLFTWIYPIFPLLSKKQQDDLSHFYFTCLRRVLFCLHWNANLFAFALDEKTLVDRCAVYWNKFLISLSESTDGLLTLVKANLNVFRKLWLNNEYPIRCLRRSKRFVEHRFILEKALDWITSIPEYSSVPYFDIEEFSLLEEFPMTF